MDDSEHLDGDGVQTLCDEKLEGIIHKPMTRHAWLSLEQRGGDAHPEMGAESVSYTHLTLPTTPYV